MAKSRLATARFCPHCGVESIDRDFYAQGGVRMEAGHKETLSTGCEYVCHSCGFGFRLTHSKRVVVAEDLHREHRELRNHVTFDTPCVGEEVAAVFAKKFRRRRSGERTVREMDRKLHGVP